MQPILLAGPAGSGKDQAARYLATQWDLAIHHLATPLYALYFSASWQAAERHLVANGRNQTLVRRQFLQQAGDLYRRFSPTLLVDLLMERAQSEGPGIVVPDVRLPEEVTAFRHHWPTALLIYCHVPDAMRQARQAARDGTALSAPARHHNTEVDVLALKDGADIVWDNSGSWETSAQALATAVSGRLVGETLERV